MTLELNKFPQPATTKSDLSQMYKTQNDSITIFEVYQHIAMLQENGTFIAS
jgi:hypothetical protein